VDTTEEETDALKEELQKDVLETMFVVEEDV